MTNPNTLDEYIDRAKERQKLKYDKELDRKMEFKGTAVHFWRQKKAWPSPDSMRKLAKLAGADPEIAVLQLGAWTNPPETANVYRTIIQKLSGVAAALTIAAYATGANAALSAGTTGELCANQAPDHFILWKIIIRAWIARALGAVAKIVHRFQYLKAIAPAHPAFLKFN